MLPAALQLQNLPPEILDRILMKALHFEEYAWVKAKQYVSNDALLQTLARLQSATSAWRSRLNTNWFRIVFKRRRKRIGEKIEISYFLKKDICLILFCIYLGPIYTGCQNVGRWPRGLCSVT